MPAAKDLQLDIQITGNESQLAKAIGLSERQLKQLGDAVTTVNKAIGKESQAAFGTLNQGQQQAVKGFQQVEAAAEKTTREVKDVDESFQHFKATVAGVFTGEALFHGITEAIHLVQEGLRETVNLFKEASMQAAEMELKVRGIGNLFRSQAAATGMTQQLLQVAYKSPFQLMDLIDAAQRLSGFGVKKEDMVATIKDLGNIVAGTGGGKQEMDRAALAYGEAITSQTLTTREINQMTQLGVPVWEQLEKLTGKTNQELHKMIEKHELSSAYMTRVIEDLTHGDGLFANAMENFSTTFMGLLTTFQDKVGTAMRDMGDFFNVFTAEFLKFIDNTPLWDALHTWFVQLKDRAQAILTYLPTFFEKMDFMPKMEAIGTRIGAVIKKLFGGFDINEMFTQVMIPSTGNLTEVMTAKGNAWIDAMQKFIDPILNLIDRIVELAGNPAVVATVQYLADTAVFAIQDTIKLMGEFAAYLNDIGTLLHGIVTMNPEEMGKAWNTLQSDVKKYAGAEPKKEYFRDTTSQQRAELNYSAALQREMNDKLSGATAERLAKDHEEVETAKKALEEARKNTEAVKNTTAANVLAAQSILSLTSAVSAATQALSQMSTMSPGMFGGAATGASGPNVTEYGPAVDPPGSKYWDKNSYHRIGAWPAITGLLRPGDVALGYGAQAHYHVQPGQVFVDDMGRTVRFADRSGSSNPMNEDIFRMADGGIVRRPTRAIIGEAGPEAVVPLSQGLGPNVTVNYNPTIHHTGDAHHFASLLQDHAQHIANLVSDAYQSHWERTAAV